MRAGFACDVSLPWLIKTMFPAFAAFAVVVIVASIVATLAVVLIRLIVAKIVVIIRIVVTFELVVRALLNVIAPIFVGFRRPLCLFIALQNIGMVSRC